MINQGGDTTCKDFIADQDQQQTDVLTKMIKDQHGADPSNIELSATRTSVTLYCKTLGTDQSKISDAPHS